MKNAKRNLKESIMRWVFIFLACLSVALLVLICLFLFTGGLPAISKIGPLKFLTGLTWQPSAGKFGIFPMIVGSLFVTIGAIVIGVPVGVFTAAFMAKFCPKVLYKVFKPAINLLAGIPSIIYGFFGLVVIVPFIGDTFGGSGKGLLAASILLAMMILPTIVAVSESSIRAVPESYYDGALALGATKERSVYMCILPACKTGIISAVVLGIGRAIGETMAVVMVAGNQAVLPDSITSGLRTLTTNIVLEMGYASGLHRDSLIGVAIILFVFILLINIILVLFKRKGKR